MTVPETGINRTALQANPDAEDGSDGTVLVTRQQQGVPLSMLQSKARSLAAYDIETMVGRFDPDHITDRQKRQMRRDPMINLGLHFKKTVLVNAPWHMECEDPRVAAFADGALRAIYKRLIPQMCLSHAYGRVPIIQRFQREVPNWTYEDPKTHEATPVWPDKDIPAVTWNTFQALPPQGAHPVFGPGGFEFNGFRHDNLAKREDDTSPLVVDAAHALWVTRNFDEEFGNWYGYPVTGHAFRFWWSYWYQWLLADRHMEQDADPPALVEYPPGQSVDPETGDLVDNYVIALNAGASLRDGSTVAVPSDYYENIDTGSVARGARKWTVQFLTGGENIKAFHDSFAYLDVAKLRAVLVPEQALIGAKGSLSGDVASTYGVAFAESAAIEMAQLDQHINDYMLPRLLAQNFVDPPRCLKVTEGFREEDMALGVELIKTVAATDPGGLQVDWRALAREHNLPMMDPEEIKKQREEALKRQQEAMGGGAPGDQPTVPNQQGSTANKARTHAADPTDPAAGRARRA